VAAHQQGEQQVLDNFVLPDDDAPDLVDDAYLLVVEGLD
jgi:hypothetical protein